MAQYPARGTANWDVPLKNYIDAQDADALAEAKDHADTTAGAEAVAHVAAHEAKSDPHPQYETTAQIDTRFQGHQNDPNPHPTYDDGPSFFLLYQNAKV